MNCKFCPLFKECLGKKSKEDCKKSHEFLILQKVIRYYNNLKQ